MTPTTTPTTIRQHLETIRRELVNPNNAEHLRLHIMEYAERALAILNAAETVGDALRLVPDPEATA